MNSVANERLIFICCPGTRLAFDQPHVWNEFSVHHITRTLLKIIRTLIWWPNHDECGPIIGSPISLATVPKFTLGSGQGLGCSHLPQMAIKSNHENPGGQIVHGPETGQYMVPAGVEECAGHAYKLIGQEVSRRNSLAPARFRRRSGLPTGHAASCP